MKPLVSIIMGSTSDLKVMEAAAKFLEEMEVPFEINALSAHRTPEMVAEFAKGAAERGIKVIIAGAGGAAHLPGVIAASTNLPVIGVPIRSSNSIEGLDSILSILQMPSGIRDIRSPDTEPFRPSDKGAFRKIQERAFRQDYQGQ